MGLESLRTHPSKIFQDLMTNLFAGHEEDGFLVDCFSSPFNDKTPLPPVVLPDTVVPSGPRE